MGDPTERQYTRRELLGSGAVAATAGFVGLASAQNGESPGGVTAECNIPIGVVRGGFGGGDVDVKGVQRLRKWEQWLGREVSIVTEGTGKDTWDQIRGKTWQYEPWTDWARQSGHFYSLAVAMLPRDGEGTLQAGAAGEYNHHFRTLARRLDEAGLGQALLRIGAEHNGNFQPYAATPDPEAWVQFFRQIVETMRDVSPEFTFIWNPMTGVAGTTLRETWPGSDYVDQVGIDIYDAGPPYGLGDYWVASPPQRRVVQEEMWNLHLTGDEWGEKRPGLTEIKQFAERRGKRICIPEWGLTSNWSNEYTGEDNPVFVRKMFEWMHENDVAWHAYFDMLAGDDDHRLTSWRFPEASTEFRRLFGHDRGCTARPVPNRQWWLNGNILMIASTLAMLGLGAVSMGTSDWRQRQGRAHRRLR